MEKNEKTKYLLKNTTIFAISNMATKLITFFLVPLYTFCLTTKEYGIIDLFFTISSVIIPIMTLNVVEGIYRFSMDKGASNNKIVSIGILMFGLCILLGIITIPIFRVYFSIPRSILTLNCRRKGVTYAVVIQKKQENRKPVIKGAARHPSGAGNRLLRI